MQAVEKQKQNKKLNQQHENKKTRMFCSFWFYHTVVYLHLLKYHTHHAHKNYQLSSPWNGWVFFLGGLSWETVDTLTGFNLDSTFEDELALTRLGGIADGSRNGMAAVFGLCSDVSLFYISKCSTFKKIFLDSVRTSVGKYVSNIFALSSKIREIKFRKTLRFFSQISIIRKNKILQSLSKTKSIASLPQFLDRNIYF